MLAWPKKSTPVAGSALPWRIAVPEWNWPVRREISKRTKARRVP